jgi:hypothetical protein
MCLWELAYGKRGGSAELKSPRVARSIAPMPNRIAVALTVLAVATGGCKGRFFGPSREEVTAELRKEAETFKAKGEQSDPVLRLKSTWNIEGIDVQEQAGDKNRPYTGTVRFKIITTMHDSDGAVTNDQLDKQFNYVYDVTAKRWLIVYTPPPPVRR